MASTFLRAEWRKLAMANYKIDPKLLEPYLPKHTVLDLWNNTCYVSLVGFMFQNTRIKGFKIPFHVHFEEVNLRFYVRYKDGTAWKRGVVFIKEIVPKPALTFVANTVYKENYETMPMQHTWEEKEDHRNVEYKWKKNDKWHSFKLKAALESKEILSGSEAEFITEHYWGYTKVGEHKTSEYGVEHPRWQVYDMMDYFIDVDFGSVYGSNFAFLNHAEPLSVFLAEGSVIKVKGGRTF
jgi:uncharacterized protein YqjF (DUF2071 family)